MDQQIDEQERMDRQLERAYITQILQSRGSTIQMPVEIFKRILLKAMLYDEYLAGTPGYPDIPVFPPHLGHPIISLVPSTPLRQILPVPPPITPGMPPPAAPPALSPPQSSILQEPVNQECEEPAEPQRRYILHFQRSGSSRLRGRSTRRGSGRRGPRRSRGRRLL